MDAPPLLKHSARRTSKQRNAHEPKFKQAHNEERSLSKNGDVCKQRRKRLLLPDKRVAVNVLRSLHLHGAPIIRPQSTSRCFRQRPFLLKVRSNSVSPSTTRTRT